MVVERRPRAAAGGAEGNARLTAATAVLLLVLLALEGVTIVSLRSLLSMHVFVGMLLLPPVALKLGAVAWRFARYYAGRDEYLRKGPPTPFLRFLVAPVVVASTFVLFASGVALIAFGPRHPLLVVLHKASFVVWFGAMTIHVLAYVLRLPELVGADLGRGERVGGAALRRWSLAAVLVAGAVLAWATLPLAGPWHTWMFGR